MPDAEVATEPETEEPQGLTDEEKAAFADALSLAPSFRVARGPSIHPPGDPHYTWDDFTRDSPGAQAAAAGAAAELAAALQEVQDLREALAKAKAQQDPAARAAELREELAALEAANPAPAAADGAAADPGAAPVS
jgi:hypothetical protein